MQKRNLVAVNDFCTHHQIEVSFIHSLHQAGLVDFISVKKIDYIEVEQLHLLEKYVCFHYELNINIEGIETISHMLKRLYSMHEEIVSLKNRLMLYEEY